MRSPHLPLCPDMMASFLEITYISNSYKPLLTGEGEPFKKPEPSKVPIPEEILIDLARIAESDPQALEEIKKIFKSIANLAQLKSSPKSKSSSSTTSFAKAKNF